MRKSILLLFGLSFLLIQPLAVSSAGRIAVDQMQPIVDDTVGGLVIGGKSAQKLAQTVSAGLNGHLLGLFLPVGCDSGFLLIEIRELDGTEPGDVVLAQRRIPAVHLPARGPVFRLILMRGRLAFSAGDRFAVVLQNPKGACGIFQGSKGDSYPGGEGFFDARPNPPGWIPFSDTEPRLDLPFMTLIMLD